MTLELHTQRLRFEPLHHRHASDVFALFGNATVMRYSSMTPRTRAQSDALLADRLAGSAAGRACSWIMRDLAENLVGQLTLFGIDHGNLRAEIGYALLPEWWGKGFASEAVTTGVRYAFGHLGLCRLEADVDPDNIGSWRALEKNGFRREGFLPKRWHKQGRFYDTWFYGLLNERRINELARTS